MAPDGQFCADVPLRNYSLTLDLELFDAVILESLADIATRPQNVIVLENKNATLECSTDSTPSQGSSAIEWKYDRNIIVHTDHVSRLDILPSSSRHQIHKLTAIS